MNQPNPIKVLIVDDSAFMRKAVASMLKNEEGIQIVGEARDGQEGLELAAKLRPDVMTLDVEMPRLDGLTALQKIMAECPTHVIMLSSLTTAGSHAAMTALKLGAADAMAKDASQVSFTITALKDELVAKVRALGASRKPAARRPGATKISIAPTDIPRFKPAQFELICIGSSTGGPPVLEAILTALPETLHPPIVVAQHMPELFTRSMAERLNDACKLRVVHASDGMNLEPRTVYIAPGAKNAHIRRHGPTRLTLEINRDPAGTIYFPSVDALFASAATATAARTLAIVLTGMGDDGLKGARPLKAAGGTILAQNEDTCVVYGMPRAVTVAGLVAASLPPEGLLESLRTVAPVAPNFMRKAS
jgi:two-component system chemotaxis response regulator CheB